MFIRVARRSSLGQARHVTPVPPPAAGDLVAQVYAQVERDFGMLAPPIALHSPSPQALAASWVILRETLVATGVTGRAVKEAVGAAVSRSNTCPYCVDVHAATLRGLADDGSAARDATAVATGGADAIGDAGLREIVRWAGASGRRDPARRGRPPGSPAEAAELAGVAVTFHYLNRMVNVFLRESPFPPGLPAAARGGLLRLLVRVLRGATLGTHPPGASLDLLPPAEPAVPLGWAAGSPTVTEAFARASTAVEAAGVRSVPGSVRELVTATLADWDGTEPPLSGGWPGDLVTGLPPADRPAGRLALLTALASYRAGPGAVEAFRRTGSDDRALIELTSWAAMTAALTVGGWSNTVSAEPINTERTDR
ncbi:carboxymuconolactone decarboxylase family protein [Actinomadura sp. 7K534]|uniref:carboxymuconolactone decarboxylase family protein n=1 Tax=Actinomadura sp. 7K534 TaxID=2530366 RepID=UPI00105248DF|nr:carboxymuconolactone decarboxylase family protein [Actinomadura sp. 7K534]TDB98889.1 carboxymuconolactone decarboxylase family protein [Actinomadura sp. 7K534]